MVLSFVCGSILSRFGRFKNVGNSKQMLNQAEERGNALSIIWSFGGGETATVGTDEFQVTKVTHTFTQPDLRTII